MIKKLYWFLFVRDLNASPDQTSGDTGTLLKDLSYIVLCAYIFYIFSPYVPLIADGIAHTFWEKEHLQSAHHQYGNNHAGLEMIKAEKQTGRENATNNAKTGQENITHTRATCVNLDAPFEKIIDLCYASYSCGIPASYPDIDYPPPRS